MATIRQAVASKELAKAAAPGTALAEAVAEGRLKMSPILAAVGIDPRNPTHQAALLAAEKYQLDPLLKHIIVIPKGGVYITRDGWLHIAHRSGQLDGIEVVDEGEDDTHWLARVAVYRKDMSRPFVFTGRYPRKGGNAAHGPEMAVKVAEVAALRRAFPVAGVGAADAQWDIDDTPAAEPERTRGRKADVAADFDAPDGEPFFDDEPAEAEVVDDLPDTHPDAA